MTLHVARVWRRDKLFNSVETPANTKIQQNAKIRFGKNPLPPGVASFNDK